MAKVFTISFLFLACLQVHGQQFSRPVDAPEAFLANTRTYLESVTLGGLAPLSDSLRLAENLYIRAGAGLRIGYSKRRITFRDDLIFEENQGDLIMSVNDDPARDYPDQWPRRGYTRLEGQYVRIGISGGILVGKLFQISTGINADFRVGSRYLDKHYIDGDKQKDKLSGNDLLQLNGQQYAWVVQAGFQGLSVCYEISLNPFFQESWGLDYRFQSFGIVYGF